MNGKRKISSLLHQNYCQFIQFINDLVLPRKLYLATMIITPLIIYSELAQNIDQNHFLHIFSHVSFTEQMMHTMQAMPWFFVLVKALPIFILLQPLIIVIALLLITFAKRNTQKLQIGDFYHIYKSSIIFQIFRICFTLFQKITMPVFISIGIKICFIEQRYNDIGFGVTLIVLTFLNAIIYSYYSLQMPSQSRKVQNKQINFPNPILDIVIVSLMIIVLGCTKDLAKFLSCLCLSVVRTLSFILFKFQGKSCYKIYLFILLCWNSISLALLIAFLTNQYSIMAVSACLTCAFLFNLKFKYTNQNEKYIKIKQNSKSEHLKIEDVIKNLIDEKIATAYREAVLISRKKNTHRNQILIDILKSKCYQMQCQSRGSTKLVNSLQLLQYEIRIVQIIKKTLAIQQKAIQALTILKNKQPKQQIFIKTAIQLADMINENKNQFIQCIKINFMAAQLTVLMFLFFKQLYNDSVFLRETKTEFKQTISQSYQKRLQKQLFGKDTALVVINVIDQIGKIIKVSNNMPNVLGYSANSLVGLSINELIPLSIRQIHDSILCNFIDQFTCDVMRQKHSIEFYAIDRQLHLQKVQICYKFFMHRFQIFQLSSIIRKLKTQQYLILTDELGNIEGWSSQIGELFNFDQFSGNEYNAYNFNPLLPASIKYDTKNSSTFKTVFFRLSKMKSSKLILFDAKQKLDPGDFKTKQIQTFQNLLQNGDIIEAFFVNVEIQIKVIKRSKKIVKIIKFTQLKRIQNFQRLENAILNDKQGNSNDDGCQNFGFNPGIQPEKSFDESEDAQYSILKGSSKEVISADLNFTLDWNSPNVMQATELSYNKDVDKFQSLFSTRSLLKLDVEQQIQEFKYMSEHLTVQSNYNPKLQRKSYFIWLIVIITLGVLAVIVQDHVSLSQVSKNLNGNKTQIYKLNRAEMIYCKTVFNPNKTYIQQFNSGNLMVFNGWLYNQANSYTLSSGLEIQQNQFYLINIQIPSTLSLVQRLSGSNNQSTIELQKNFNKIINLYEKTYAKFIENWLSYIQSMKSNGLYKLIMFAFGAISYIVYLLYIFRRYKNQRKMAEAFFKFQKSDIDQRIGEIKSISFIIQKRCQQWFIDQYLYDIKKCKSNRRQQQKEKLQTLSSKKMNAISSKSQQELGQKKSPISDDNDQFQNQMSRKRFNYIILIIAIIVITQLLFLILRGILISKMLQSYGDIIIKANQANKLIVYPNLRLANLYYPAPSNILSQYQTAVQNTLNQPIQWMPTLFSILSQKPCTNCQFLSQILNTNYRSFYSYFDQTIISNSTISKKDLQSIYHAVDVVVGNISGSFATKQISDPFLTILLYIFSITVFFGSAFIIIRLLDEEILKLQCFLKFLNVETLLKNKHMSTIMAKNI